MYADPISSSLIDDSSRAFDSIRSFTIFFIRSFNRTQIRDDIFKASKQTVGRDVKTNTNKTISDAGHDHPAKWEIERFGTLTLVVDDELLTWSAGIDSGTVCNVVLMLVDMVQPSGIKTTGIESLSSSGCNNYELVVCSGGG